MSSEPASGRGRLVVISGPSGTGKTSICNALLERLPGSVWSVSVTTRPRRSSEVEGQSYRFVDREAFLRQREAGEFLESAEYIGHLYGTPRRPLIEATEAGRHVVMEIDVQGGIQVAAKMPDSVRVFVLPPTMATLKARLAGRRTESPEEIQRRIAEADGEIGLARDSGAYPHFVTNDVLEDTVDRIIELIERTRKQ